MNKISMTIAIIAALGCALMSSPGWAKQPNIVVHTADRAYPSPTDPPIQNAAIVIRDGRIVAVGSKDSVAIPSGAVTYEHKGATMMAGFWNSHVHLMEEVFADAAAPADALTSHLRRMLLQYGAFTRVTLALLRGQRVYERE